MKDMTTTIDHLPPTEEPEGPAAPRSGSTRPAEEDQASPTWADFHALEARVQQRGGRRDVWTMLIVVFAGIAVLFGIIGIGLGSRAVDDSKQNIRAASAPGAPVAPVAAAPAPAVSPVAVTLSEFQVRPGATTIAAGKVTLQIANAGMMPHELLVFRSDLAPADYPMHDGDIDETGPGITKVSDGDNLAPGTNQTRVVDFTQTGTYLLVCNLPGHFKMGMYSVITVK
jgi:uncharacterized cupredoxin-like copper-binding protein